MKRDELMKNYESTRTAYLAAEQALECDPAVLAAKAELAACQRKLVLAMEEARKRLKFDELWAAHGRANDAYFEDAFAAAEDPVSRPPRSASSGPTIVRRSHDEPGDPEPFKP